VEYDGGRPQLQFGFSTVEPRMIEPRREPWLNHGSLREKTMVFLGMVNHMVQPWLNHVVQPWLNHMVYHTQKTMVFQLWFNHGFFSVGHCRPTNP